MLSLWLKRLQKKSSKMTIKSVKISDDVKIFRLMPVPLLLAFGFSIYSAIQTQPMQAIHEIYNEEQSWKSTITKIIHFFGFYIGNGIPRFAVYLFCICYIKYNFNRFHIDDLGCTLIALPFVSFPLIGAEVGLPGREDGNHIFVTYFSYLIAEFFIYKAALVKRQI